MMPILGSFAESARTSTSFVAFESLAFISGISFSASFTALSKMSTFSPNSNSCPQRFPFF